MKRRMGRVLIVCENYRVIGKPFPREILVSYWLKGASEQERI